MGTAKVELKNEAAMQRSRVNETLEAIGDRMSPERMVEGRKAAIGQRWQQAKGSVMGSPQYVESVTRRVQEAPEMNADHARGNPIAAGLVAFGVGALFATVMPKSRTEQRLVEQAKPLLQQATEELKDADRDVASTAKEHAQEAAQEVKANSRESVAAVKEQAQDSAQEFCQQAT